MTSDAPASRQMISTSLSVVITGLVGGLLTPLIVRWWSRATPPAETSPFDSLGMEVLRARNNRIDNIGTVFSFCGMLTAFPFYFGGAKSNNFWPVGLAMGMMVIFPVTFFWLATRHGGVARWHEFWRFYELKWGIGLRGLRWVYVPLAGLGLVSLAMLLV
jgi:hypothetical protein